MTDHQIKQALQNKYPNGKVRFVGGFYADEQYLDIAFTSKEAAESCATNELCRFSEELHSWDVHIEMDRYKSNIGGDEPQLTL